ncbi:MAG: phage tail tape measure protein [Eubacterium sp.]|nr:phage tail tape measure protein [Eubacterium sp.]
MANLSVIFNAVDNISNKLSTIGSQVDSVADSFSKIEQESDEAFDAVADGAEDAENTMEAFAESVADGMIEAFKEMAEEANLSEEEIEATIRELPGFFKGIGEGMEEALDGVGDEADKTGDDIEELGEEFEDTGRKGKKSSEDMKDGMNALEGFLAAAGIVTALKKIASAFADCAAQAETVETAYAKLETIAGAGAMDSLKGQIQALSSETGIAAADLADVAYNAISAGTAVEDSVTMAATASKLATAGFTDTSSALSVLTTAINAYGDAAGTAEQISDSLITVQNLGVTTVADLSANMGKAIATASAYNVSLDNLESSYISITKAGINTAEGTTYISSMLKELGTEGSSVAKVLEEETGQSFAELMASGYSLADVLGVLYTACDNDATALMNLWGSAEAGKASNAIVSQGLEEFNDNLVTLQESAGATADAYATMADTTEYAHTRMENSMTNLETAVGNNLNPMLEKLYNGAATVLDWMAKITEKAPILTSLVTAVAVAVGILAVAITGYTVVTKVAAAAEAAYTAMLETEAGAMTLKLGLVGALTAALAILAVSIMSAQEEEEEMTASTDAMNDRLSELNSKYEETCEQFGETSAEAQELKGEMTELESEIEANSMTLAEFYEHLNNVCDAHDNIVSSFRSVQEEADKNQATTDNLINKLRELSESADDSTESQAEMEAIVKRLNQMYPELGISIDDVNNNLDELAEKIEKVNGATKQAEYEAAQQTYADLIAEQDELIAAQEEAAANLDRAREKYSDQNWVSGTWNELWGSGATEALDDAQAAYDRVNAAVQENQSLLDETAAVMESYTDVVNGTSEEVISAEDAVSIAIAQNQEAVEALAEEYQAAYDAALSSIQGQWELWETADEVTEASIEDMNAAMQSQIDYWNSYAENLESLHARNIEGLDEMVASMDDGSTESAAYLQAMSEASDEELAAMVANFENLQEAQAATADDMATLSTDFDARLAEIEASFEDTVSNMNMESEAYSAAQSTIQGYIDGIKSMRDSAAAAAAAVANAASANLKTSGSGGSTEHHAKGTLSSGDVYIAGEEGEELILSGGGDTVFPASETNKIIQAVNNYEGNTDNSETTNNNAITDESSRGDSNTYVVANTTGNEEGVSSSRTVTLDIKGSGSLTIDSGTDKETVWETIKDNIKSSVMSILSEEIFEGSEGAYEY